MKLLINDKTYIAPKPKARLFREALVITKQNDLEDMNADTLDALLGFVTDVFKKEFSIDDIYDSLESDELVPTVVAAIQFVTGGGDKEEDGKK